MSVLQSMHPGSILKIGSTDDVISTLPDRYYTSSKSLKKAAGAGKTGYYKGYSRVQSKGAPLQSCAYQRSALHLQPGDLATEAGQTKANIWALIIRIGLHARSRTT